MHFLSEFDILHAAVLLLDSSLTTARWPKKCPWLLSAPPQSSSAISQLCECLLRSTLLNAVPHTACTTRYRSQETAASRNNKTINAQHVLDSIKELGWPESEALQKHLKSQLKGWCAYQLAQT